MDKLIDISRQDGFPLCAETIEVLNGFSSYINMMFDGLILPARTAICMQGFTHISTIMYVQSYEGSSGHTPTACRVASNFKPGDVNLPTLARLINNPGKYSLADRSTYVDIDKDNSTKYERVIYVEQKEIVLADANNPGWTFYTLEDLYQRRAWKNVDRHSATDYSNLTIHPSSKIRRDRFGNTLDIQIDMTHDAVRDWGNLYLVDPGLTATSDSGLVSLSAIAMSSGTTGEVVPCFLERSTNPNGNISASIYVDYTKATASSVRTIIRGTVALK